MMKAYIHVTTSFNTQAICDHWKFRNNASFTVHHVVFLTEAIHLHATTRLEPKRNKLAIQEDRNPQSMLVLATMTLPYSAPLHKNRSRLHSNQSPWSLTMFCSNQENRTGWGKEGSCTPSRRLTLMWRKIKHRRRRLQVHSYPCWQLFFCVDAVCESES